MLKALHGTSLWLVECGWLSVVALSIIDPGFKIAASKNTKLISQLKLTLAAALQSKQQFLLTKMPPE